MPPLLTPPRLLAVLASLACVHASAAVLTFEEFRSADELQGVGATIFSKGFVLQYTPAQNEPNATSFQAVGPSWRFNYRRTTAMNTNSCSATTTITTIDNNPLTLLSIDLSALNGDSSYATTFTGITTEGQIVRRTVQVTAARGWKTFLFPSSFTNLRSVSWNQGNCTSVFPHMFDNIVTFPTWRGRNED